MAEVLATNKIEGLPLSSKSADPYIWADYFELRCLFHPDREINTADVLDIVEERQDLGEVEEFDSSDVIEDLDLLPDEYEDFDDRYDFYLEEPSGESPLEETPGQLADRNERQAFVWLEHLEYRQRAFGDFYPYEVGGRTLRCKDEIESDPRIALYLFLLLCSSLKYISKNYEGEFTSRFEIVSMVALKSLLPKRGTVSLVGKNGLNQGKYAGTIWHKITLLAEEIGEKISSKCSEGEFEPNDTGDRGLDILGKVSLGDNLPSTLVLFGQCACGKQWVDKQFEAHYLSWKSYIDFTAPPNNLVFIPYCFRSADGGWYKHLDLKEEILIDRLRLVHLLRNKLNVLARLHPYNRFVAGVLAYTESLVGS